MTCIRANKLKATQKKESLLQSKAKVYDDVSMQFTYVGTSPGNVHNKPGRDAKK